MKFNDRQNGRSSDSGDSNRNRGASQEKLWVGAKYVVALVALLVIAWMWVFTPVSNSTAPGEQLSISLPDGSEVRLAGGSTITYQRFFAITGREVHLTGETLIQADPSDRPLKIRSGESVTELMGGRINLRYLDEEAGGRTSLAVISGEAALYPSAFPEERISVPAEHLAYWEPGMESVSEPQPVATDEVTAWSEERAVFLDRPLKSILDELGRRHAVEISLDDEADPERRLTVVYNEPRPLDIILTEIGLATGTVVTETERGYRLTVDR